MKKSKISRSFNNNNRKEEPIAILPSSIDSIDNKSSSLMTTTTSLSSVMKNPSINNEKNPPTSKAKKTKTRSRTNFSSGRPIRSKVVKDSSTKNGPYTIPYSTRSQTQQQQQQLRQQNLTDTLDPSTIVNSNPKEGTNNNNSTITTTPSQVSIPGRKKYCAKCKESANIVKMINSKMSRIEELVANLKKVVDESGTNNSHRSLTSYEGMDFSKMSMEDLQNIVMIITSAFMSSKTTSNSSPLSAVKMELEGSRSP